MENNQFIVKDHRVPYRTMVRLIYNLYGTYVEKCKYEFESSLLRCDLNHGFWEEKLDRQGPDVHYFYGSKTPRNNRATAIRTFFRRSKGKRRKFEIRSRLREIKLQQNCDYQTNFKVKEVSEEVKLDQLDKLCHFKLLLIQKRRLSKLNSHYSRSNL
jgi:hypothetical protein